MQNTLNPMLAACTRIPAIILLQFIPVQCQVAINISGWPMGKGVGQHHIGNDCSKTIGSHVASVSLSALSSHKWHLAQR